MDLAMDIIVIFTNARSMKWKVKARLEWFKRREWNKLEVNTREILSACVCVWEIEKRNKAMDWSPEGWGVKTEFRNKTIIVRLNADDNIQRMGIKNNSGYHGKNFQEKNPWERDIGWVQSTTEYMVLD